MHAAGSVPRGACPPVQADAWRSQALRESAAESALRLASDALERDLGLVTAAQTALAPVSPGTTELALLEDAILQLEQAREDLSDAKARLWHDRAPTEARRHVEMALQRHDQARYATQMAQDMMASQPGHTPAERQVQNLLLLLGVTTVVTEDRLKKTMEALQQ